MAERNYLSIGQVVNLLRGAYPDLSNSKIRFLEDEGLITPHRTPKGYRQYSKEDVDRLEVILHLQKTRYMPLNVIKQRLENATDLSTLAYEVGLLSDVPLKTEPKETKQKLHPIETIPDMLGVEISFIRSLAENDLIRIIKSPQNRELVDGRDFPIIRYCSELSVVESTKYRIVAAGKTYNITYANPMGYKHNSLKFNCKLEKNKK